MKKMLLWCVVVAVVGYVATAVMAMRLMPAKIAEAEKRLPGIQVAIAQIAGDQSALSRRVREIASATLGRGQTKVDEVERLLADDELNHLALTYHGSDWSIQSSAFLGAVRHTRKMLDDQQKDLTGDNERLMEKIKDLEAKKRALSMRPKSPADRISFAVQMNELDTQLNLLRNSSRVYRGYYEKGDAVRDKIVAAKAKNEDMIFKLANDYENQTVGRLNKTLAETLGRLRWEACEPARLREQMSYFNIWPLNMLMKMPIGE